MAADKGAGMEIKAHVQTYEAFTRLMKTSSISVLVIAAIVILLISR